MKVDENYASTSQKSKIFRLAIFYYELPVTTIDVNTKAVLIIWNKLEKKKILNVANTLYKFCWYIEQTWVDYRKVLSHNTR